MSCIFLVCRSVICPPYEETRCPDDSVRLPSKWTDDQCCELQQEWVSVTSFITFLFSRPAVVPFRISYPRHAILCDYLTDLVYCSLGSVNITPKHLKQQTYNCRTSRLIFGKDNFRVSIFFFLLSSLKTDILTMQYYVLWIAFAFWTVLGYCRCYSPH